MSKIYHITTQGQLAQAIKDGTYATPSLETEGFIHLSQRHQVLKVANSFYKDQQNLVCLIVETTLLEAPLKFEPPAHPDGKVHADISTSEMFPHLFGRLNMSAVVALAELMLDDAGNFVDLGPEKAR